MRPEELLARDALLRYLAREVPWSAPEIAAGPDPPDLLLWLEVVYAVEVTAIIGSTSVGRRKMKNAKVARALTAFAEDLASEFEGTTAMSGTYAVHLEPVPNITARKPGIRARVASYLNETRSLEDAPERAVGSGWSICKLAGSGSLLGYTYGLGDAAWQGEIETELFGLVAESVQRKRTRLSDARVQKPWILLLFDGYHLADYSIWSEAVARSNKDDFAWVARVDGSGRCYPLGVAPWMRFAG